MRINIPKFTLIACITLAWAVYVLAKLTEVKRFESEGREKGYTRQNRFRVF